MRIILARESIMAGYTFFVKNTLACISILAFNHPLMIMAYRVPANKDLSPKNRRIIPKQTFLFKINL